MKINYIILIVLLSFVTLNSTAQKVDVDQLLKRALHETNVTKNYSKAKTLAKRGLEISPNYTDIRLLLGRLYRLTDKPDSARLEFAKVLAKEPANADALNYLKSLDNAEEANEIASLKNRVSVTYNPTFFEREGKDTWNLLNVYYARLTKYGTILGRINYANRSYADGLQYELEAYPKHKKAYSFVNFAYSNAAVFQKYRASYSYIRSFEKGWEGELGLRYQYNTVGLMSYGGSVGKYLGNYWLNARAFITPFDGVVAHSYAVTARYYTNTADDYFTAIIGTGISPDDRARNFELEERLNTNSFRLSLGYQQLIWKRNVISILGTFNREEYVIGRKENEFDIAINFQHRF